MGLPDSLNFTVKGINYKTESENIVVCCVPVNRAYALYKSIIDDKNIYDSYIISHVVIGNDTYEISDIEYSLLQKGVLIQDTLNITLFNMLLAWINDSPN